MITMPNLDISSYSLLEVFIFAVLIIIGLIILIFIVKLLLIFLPAAVIALVVWFLTSSLFWAGVAFVVVAIIAIARRL